MRYSGRYLYLIYIIIDSFVDVFKVYYGGVFILGCFVSVMGGFKCIMGCFLFWGVFQEYIDRLDVILVVFGFMRGISFQVV